MDNADRDYDDRHAMFFARTVFIRRGGGGLTWVMQARRRRRAGSTGAEQLIGGA